LERAALFLRSRTANRQTCLRGRCREPRAHKSAPVAPSRAARAAGTRASTCARFGRPRTLSGAQGVPRAAAEIQNSDSSSQIILPRAPETVSGRARIPGTGAHWSWPSVPGVPKASAVSGLPRRRRHIHSQATLCIVYGESRMQYTGQCEGGVNVHGWACRPAARSSARAWCAAARPACKTQRARSGQTARPCGSQYLVRALLAAVY
jgi:hypothetical protein